MDGRRGLVPSNYMTKLVGEDLMEFHQSMVVGTSGGGVGEVADDGWSTSIPQVRSSTKRTKIQGRGIEPDQTRLPRLIHTKFIIVLS